MCADCGCLDCEDEPIAQGTSPRPGRFAPQRYASQGWVGFFTDATAASLAARPTILVRNTPVAPLTSQRFNRDGAAITEQTVAFDDGYSVDALDYDDELVPARRA